MGTCPVYPFELEKKNPQLYHCVPANHRSVMLPMVVRAYPFKDSMVQYSNVLYTVQGVHV